MTHRGVRRARWRHVRRAVCSGCAAQWGAGAAARDGVPLDELNPCHPERVFKKPGETA